MKYCKDCEHYLNPLIGGGLFPTCGKTKVTVQDMVHGLRTGFEYCMHVRADAERCGEEAKWFEPKATE